MDSHGANLSERCMGCMALVPPYDDAVACPHCGFVEAAGGTDGDTDEALPLRTLLNNRYLIGRAIGAGGFGITYIAWDTLLENRVAIKEYFPADAAARSREGLEVRSRSRSTRELFDGGLSRFLAEARTLARFQDESGIVQVRDYFGALGTGYLVMSYLDGKTLKAYLLEREGKRMPYELARDLFMPVMDTLRLVHESGLMHRDISPDNLFITYAGQVRLLDFGAAKSVMSERSRSIAAVFKTGFTPYEQYLENGRLGPHTDLYALAATFYCAITGRVPPGALERHTRDELQPPSVLGVDVPAAAERALMKALAVLPEGRYASIAEFQDALLRVSSPGRMLDPLSAWERLRLLVASALAGLPPPVRRLGIPLFLGCAVAALGAMYWFSLDDPSPQIVAVDFPAEVVSGSTTRLKLNFADPDGDLVRLDLLVEQGSLKPDSVPLTNVAGMTAGTVETTLKTPQVEKVRLSLVLVDKQGHRGHPAKLDFAVVEPPQSPPGIVRIDAEKQVASGETITLRAAFEDPDADVKRLIVTQPGGPDFPPVESAPAVGRKRGVLEFSTRAGEPGSYRYVLVVEDARGQRSDPREVDVTIVAAKPSRRETAQNEASKVVRGIVRDIKGLINR